jgi:hypothetical protein
MVDILSLARHLRTKFPKPTVYHRIFAEMKKRLKKAPDDTTQYDAYKALLALWQRADWVLDNDVGAVQLLPNEDVEFDNDYITLTRVNGNSVMQTSFARGEKSERIIWF